MKGTQSARANSWVCAHCHRLVPANIAHKCLEYDRYVEGGMTMNREPPPPPRDCRDTIASVAEALTQVEADTYALTRARREHETSLRAIEPQLIEQRNRRGELSQQLLELIAQEGERRADG